MPLGSELPPINPDTPPDFKAQGEQLAVGLTEPVPMARVAKTLIGAGEVLISRVVELFIRSASWIAIQLATAVMRAEDRSAGAFQGLTRAAIKDLTGSDAGAGAGGIGRTLMDALAGGPGAAPGGQIEPSTKGAEAYMEMVMQLALEGYVEGGITSALSLGYLDKFTELDDILANVLGLGRMSRAVMRPMMTARVITPMQWHVNKQYRPELLAAGAAIEAFIRGDLADVELREELARQGFTEKRIDILVANARKRLTFDDLVYRHYAGELSDEGVIIEARALGYDDNTARLLLAIANHKRIDRWNAPIVTEAVAAFLRGEIEESELSAWVRGAAPSATEADSILSTAKARRAIGSRRLTSSDVRRLVLGGVLNVADYRRALVREQWHPDDIAALEIDLRADLDEQRDVAKAKQQQAAERALEKEAAAQARAKRDAEIADKKAREQFPALAEYRRAYVHGVIDRDVLAEALTRDGIVQDQSLYLGDADEDRGAFLLAQEKRAKAESVAAAGGLSIAQLEQAVASGVLTLEEFDAQLARRETPDDDRRVLTAMLKSRLDTRAAAEAKRKEAEQRAQLAGVSNADWQRAVRLGVRTIDQYADFLGKIDTPDLAKALILDLLRKEMADDATAAAKRDARDAEAAKRGIALSERRRAVIAGVRPIDWYAKALPPLNWPVEDQLADLDLLRMEVANAEAVRAKRAEIAKRDAERAAAAADKTRQQPATEPKGRPAPTITLAQLESAFKLGLITADEFADALIARDYDDADAEMIVQLAVLSIPNVRAGAQEREKVIAAQTSRDAPLAEMERAVRRGIRTLDDYQAEIARRGFSEDATELMAENMAEQLAIDAGSLRLKIAAAMVKGSAEFTLDELIAAFDAGELDAAQLREAMINAGAPADAALVYSRLVGTFGAGV